MCWKELKKQQKKDRTEKSKKAEVDGGLDNKIMAQLDSIGELIKKLQEVHTIVKDFLKRVKINGWKWHTQIGAGDAASTGIVTGYAWGDKRYGCWSCRTIYAYCRRTRI